MRHHRRSPLHRRPRFAAVTHKSWPPAPHCDAAPRLSTAPPPYGDPPLPPPKPSRPYSLLDPPVARSPPGR
uniref:Uncharacterized protein n=1 Tax=Oryza rufipogon TaxID=4529 RepID=A0A0E0RGE6_ORYRU